MSIDKRVGTNIKKYRLAYKMTLEELAKQIHKSKSTISKYEKGLISLDMATLEEISQVLKVAPSQLLAAEEDEFHTEELEGEFFDRQYMYSYDGRSKRILKSIIERYILSDSGQMRIQLFYDVKDVQNPGDCKALYAGMSRKYEFIENYTLQNQNNPTEQVLICCINSLSLTNRKLGMLTGLSYKTMLPVAIKVMIASSVLKEDNELIEGLKLTKEDIKISKKYNLFTIDQFME